MVERVCHFPLRVELRGAPNAVNLSQVSDAVAQAVGGRLAEAASALAAREHWRGYRQVYAPPTFVFRGRPMDAGLQRRIAVALEGAIARAISSAPAASAPVATPPARPPPPPPQPSPPPPPAPPPVGPPARIPLAPERSETGWRLNGVSVFEIEPLPGQAADADSVTIDPAISTLDDGRSQLQIRVLRPRDVAVTLLPGALAALAHLASEVVVREAITRPPERLLFHVPDAYELQEILARERGETLGPIARQDPPTLGDPQSAADPGPADPRGPPGAAPTPSPPAAHRPPAPKPPAASDGSPSDQDAAPGRILGRWPQSPPDGRSDGGTGETQTHVFESGTLLTEAEHGRALRRLLRGEGLILPYRKRPAAGARPSPILVTRLPGARMRVRLRPGSVSGYADDPGLRIPPGIGDGVVLREADLIGVKLFDEGGEVAYLPAILLPQLDDDDTRAALLKISRADRAAALLQIANGQLQAERRWLVETWPEQGAALAGAIELLVAQPPGGEPLSRRDAQRVARLRRSFRAWRERSRAEEATLAEDRAIWARRLQADVETLLAALTTLGERSRSPPAAGA